jgi:toxin ParE1/3/4
MTLSIDFHPEAANEAVNARKWYEDIDTTLGKEFSDELETAIIHIATAPERWTRHLNGTRCIKLRRFPYIVIYRHSGDQIQVIALQHTRRRPGYWNSRVV